MTSFTGESILPKPEKTTAFALRLSSRRVSGDAEGIWHMMASYRYSSKIHVDMYGKAIFPLKWRAHS